MKKNKYLTDLIEEILTNTDVGLGEMATQQTITKLDQTIAKWDQFTATLDRIIEERERGSNGSS